MICTWVSWKVSLKPINQCPCIVDMCSSRNKIADSQLFCISSLFWWLPKTSYGNMSPCEFWGYCRDFGWSPQVYFHKLPSENHSHSLTAALDGLCVSLQMVPKQEGPSPPFEISCWKINAISFGARRNINNVTRCLQIRRQSICFVGKIALLEVIRRRSLWS